MTFSREVGAVVAASASKPSVMPPAMVNVFPAAMLIVLTELLCTTSPGAALEVTLALMFNVVAFVLPTPAFGAAPN